MSDAKEVYSVYFHVDHPGHIQVAVRGPTVDGISQLIKLRISATKAQVGRAICSLQYSNQWVCDVDGRLQKITAAESTHDNTARGCDRLNYAGGITNNVFFLRNFRFFEHQILLDQIFQRDPTKVKIPVINFDESPRSWFGRLEERLTTHA